MPNVDIKLVTLDDSTRYKLRPMTIFSLYEVVCLLCSKLENKGREEWRLNEFLLETRVCIPPLSLLVGLIIDLFVTEQVLLEFLPLETISLVCVS